MREVKIVSSTFSSGGAERVLAHLVNEQPNYYLALSLSKNNDYLEEHVKCQSFDLKSRWRITRIIAKLRFLIIHLNSRDRILLSDWTLLLIIKLLNSLLFLELDIVYRPSINAGYIEDALLRRVKSKIFEQRLMRYALVQVSCVFQSKEIERSFMSYGIINSIVIANPLGMKKFREVSSTGTVSRCLFIGRATYEKGFDRFCELAVNDKAPIIYEHYGEKSHEYISDKVLEMGWLSTSRINLSDALILVPSRLEGFPNIVLELLQVQANVWVSHEVSQYFNEYPLINRNLNIVDFSNTNEHIINQLFNSRFTGYTADLSELPTIHNYSNQILNLFK